MSNTTLSKLITLQSEEISNRFEVMATKLAGRNVLNNILKYKNN